ncbi:MAG: hypothetical protein ABR573_04150 [Candidatus Dormibacteria bacterium]
MGRGIGHPRRWQLAAVGAQLGLVGACGVLGWQLLHPASPAGALVVQHSHRAQAAPELPLRLPALTAGAVQPRPEHISRPALESVISRVNSDDARLYRSQWATLRVVADGIRAYVVGRVVPLLMAAAGDHAR